MSGKNCWGSLRKGVNVCKSNFAGSNWFTDWQFLAKWNFGKCENNDKCGTSRIMCVANHHWRIYTGRLAKTDDQLWLDGTSPGWSITIKCRLSTDGFQYNRHSQACGYDSLRSLAWLDGSLCPSIRQKLLTSAGIPHGAVARWTEIEADTVTDVLWRWSITYSNSIEPAEGVIDIITMKEGSLDASCIPQWQDTLAKLAREK